MGQCSIVSLILHLDTRLKYVSGVTPLSLHLRGKEPHLLIE